MSEVGGGRRWMYRAVMMFLLWVVAEAICFVTLCVLGGGMATPRVVSLERKAVRKAMEGAGGGSRIDPANADEAMAGAPSGSAAGVPSETAGGGAKGGAPRTPQLLPDVVIHPYLGYTFDPARTSDSMEAYWKRGRRINSHGFIGREEPLAREPAEAVIVAILGGSVALELTIDGTDAFASRLARVPAFRDRDVEIVTLAVNGYKQPQQLMALAYYLSLGAHFDVVLNLDGFNEIVLPQVEHARFEVFPYYPRSWYWRVQEVPDPALRRAMGAVSYLEERRRERAAQFSRRPYRYSSIWNLAWKVVDRRLQSRIADARGVLFGSAGGSRRNAAAQGPPFPAYADEDATRAALAEHWVRCSIAMRDLCAGRDIPYFHFLQPNQYVPGAKPIGPEERAVAYQDGGRLQQAVVAGYPRLLAASTDLLAQGVRFHDLTRVFGDVDAPLYADTCCHLNEDGNRLLGEAIGDIVARDLADE